MFHPYDWGQIYIQMFADGPSEIDISDNYVAIFGLCPHPTHPPCRLNEPLTDKSDHCKAWLEASSCSE